MIRKISGQLRIFDVSFGRWVSIMVSVFLGLNMFVYLVVGLENGQVVTLDPIEGMNQDHVEEIAENTFVIGIDVPYEPFSYYSGTELIGYDIDLVNAIAVELNVDIEYKIVPWETIFDELVAGNLDAIASAVSITPGREEIMDFTLPYLAFSNEDVPIGIAVQQGDLEKRRMFNEALWTLRENGTLETIRIGVDAYAEIHYPEIDVLLPDWPETSTDTQTTLTYTDTQGSTTVVQIPADAVTETLLIEYTPTETDTVPSGFSILGQAFDLDAYRDGIFVDDVFIFNTPATITYSYSITDVIGIDEDVIMLEYWNEDLEKWGDAACGPYNRNPEKNWLAVPICHLSRFAFVEERYFIHLPLTVTD